MANRNDFTTDSRTVIRTIDRTISRGDIPLLALNNITSEYSLEYFKDLSPADMPRNLDKFFEELRAIHELLQEELDELREYKTELEAKVKPHVQ